MSTDKWTDEEDVVRAMQCYSATKNGEIMPLAATQRDPDTIIPSEERQIAYEIIYL